MRHTLYYNKTRLAPTPSGYLHLGNVYSFLYTTAFAHHTGAKVLLRIDDLDKDRSRPQYIQDIFDTLEFMGIPWDEGPRNAAEFEKEYSQNHRLGLYTEALNKLKSDGLLYACNCSRSQLSELGEYAGTCRDKNLSFDAPGVNWRLRTPASMSIKVKDPEGSFATVPLQTWMQDLVVRKKDGYPSYHLACVVDDIHYGIDLVVRGFDLWDSTLGQLYLASQLGQTSFSAIAFRSHNLLWNEEGEKLSKSAGATSVHYLRQQGKTAADIFELIGNAIGCSEPLRSMDDFKRVHQFD